MSPGAAAAILTYHRIPDREDSDRQFHDVPLQRFQSQMTVLARRVVRAENWSHRLDNGLGVFLTFDDGTSDHAMAATLLEERALVGTFFVIAGRLGEAGFLSPAEVRRLVAQGHRIASHTATHRRLPALGTAEIVEELESSRARLEDLTGTAVDWLAPPGGYWCPRSLAIAQELGFKVVRTMDWGYSPAPPSGAVPCLPILPQHTLGRFERVLDGRAAIWPFRLKRHFKNAVGERVYLACRDAVAARWPGRG